MQVIAKLGVSMADVHVYIHSNGGYFSNSSETITDLVLELRAATVAFFIGSSIYPYGELLRAGYVLFEFNTAANGSGTSYPYNPLVGVGFHLSSDLTLYAQWKHWPVLYLNGNGAGATVSGISTYTFNIDPYNFNGPLSSLISSDSVRRSRFEFVGWNTSADGNGTPYNSESIIHLYEDLTLYAQWEARVAIYIDCHDDILGQHHIYTFWISPNTDVNVDSLLRTSYPKRVWNSVIGWNSEADGSGISYPVNPLIVNISGDITIHAQWKPWIKVTIDPNGGSYSLGNSNSEYYLEHGTVEVPRVPGIGYGSGYSKIGCIVKGLSLNQDGSGTVYSWSRNSNNFDGTGNTYTLAKNTPVSFIQDTTFYVAWDFFGIIVYDGNGTTDTTLQVSKTSLSKNYTYVEGQLFSKTGYHFSHWNTLADGTGVSYGKGNVLNNYIHFTNTITLYAQWVVLRSITYHINTSTFFNGVPIPNVPVVINFPNNSLAYIGCSFSGSIAPELERIAFNTSADGTGTMYDLTGATILITSDLVLYAIYATYHTYHIDLNSQTASWNTNSSHWGGDKNVTNKFKMYNGELIGAIELPSPNDILNSNTKIKFDGFSTSPDGEGEIYHGPFYYGGNTSILPHVNSRDITFYAIWKLEYYITYHYYNPGYGESNSEYNPANPTQRLGQLPARVKLNFSSGEEVTYTIPPLVDVYNDTTGEIIFKALNHNTFRLCGWSELPNGKGKQYPLTGTITVFKDSIELYTMWEYMPLVTTLYTDSDPQCIPKTPSRIRKSGFIDDSFKTDIFGNLPTRSGYILREFESITVISSLVPGELDYILSPVWWKKYLLTFDGAGFTSGQLPSPAYYGIGQQVLIPFNVVRKSGNTLIGWTTRPEYFNNTYPIDINELSAINREPANGSSGGGTFIMCDNAYDINELEAPGDTILYAVWRPSFSFSYNTNGGYFVTPEQVDILPGVSKHIVIPPMSASRLGYIFNNWNTAADGTGTSYVTGDSLDILDATVVLYAQWLALYTITYHPNDISNNTNIIIDSLVEGTEITIGNNTFVKQNSTFKFWNTLADGSGIPYNPGGKVNIYSSMSLYAQWQYRPTIRYENLASGVVIPELRYNIGDTAIISSVPFRAGFIFIHWESYSSGYAPNYAAGTPVVIGSIDLVLIAKWARKVKITYVLSQVNGIITNSVEVGTSVLDGTEIYTYDATGLVFNGLLFSCWSLNPDGTGTEYQARTKIVIGENSGDLVFYAKYGTIEELSTNSIYTIYTS